QGCQGERQGVRIVRGYTEAVLCRDQLDIAADPSGDNGQPVGHVFQYGVGKPFTIRAQNTDVQMRQIGPDLRHGAFEMNQMAYAAGLRQLLEPAALLPFPQQEYMRLTIARSADYG